MKSIAFYDANIFRSMNIEEIKLYLEKYDNYITDDVVKELLEAKQNSINKAQRERLNLVFNEKMG